MNVKELIEKIEALPAEDYKNRPYIDKKVVLALVRQLDEPQKVKVPQFVADWIEECKNDDFHLFGAMEAISLNQKKLDYWFREDDNMELFARAWIFGYEVEKEKRYLVKVKGFDEYDCYLNKGLLFKKYFLESKTEIGWCRTKHTRKELEADGFGWVFDCEGIEIEEVKE